MLDSDASLGAVVVGAIALATAVVVAISAAAVRIDRPAKNGSRFRE